MWGAFNAITDRDGEHIRRVAAMLRFFGPKYLQSRTWHPFSNVTLQQAIYASAFVSEADHSTLYTIVNRIGVNCTAQLTIPLLSASQDRFVDCYHGTELKPPYTLVNGHATLTFALEGGGVGCVLHLPGGVPSPPGLNSFLRRMSKVTQRSLGSYDATWTILPQTMTPSPPTKQLATAPAGMVHVPHTTNFSFVCSSVAIENDDAVGGGFQYPWSSAPKMKQKKTLELGPFFIDRFPVTCAQYSAYLESSGYTPQDPYNFLRNLNGSRDCPVALGKKPVTYVEGLPIS